MCIKPLSSLGYPQKNTRKKWKIPWAQMWKYSAPSWVLLIPRTLQACPNLWCTTHKLLPNWNTALHSTECITCPSHIHPQRKVFRSRKRDKGHSFNRWHECFRECSDWASSKTLLVSPDAKKTKPLLYCSHYLPGSHLSFTDSLEQLQRTWKESSS